VKLGIYARSLPDAGAASATEVLDTVKRLGLDGCLFASPLDLSPTLDPGELLAVHDYADSLGLYLDLAVGQVNPYHFAARADVLKAGQGEFRAGLERLIQAAQAVGCDSLMLTIGALADRFSRSVPWADQLAATQSFLRSLAPFLRDWGFRLDLKTHEEITSTEVVRLVEAVGPDVLGIGLDPVNVLVRLEDPLAATRRVAPFTRRVYLDDAILPFIEGGLERKLRPLGDGILDWPAILAIVQAADTSPTYTIELHKGQFSMPVFEPGWLAHADPDLPIAEFAEVLRLAALSERRLTEPGTAPRDAYQVEYFERFAPSLAYLRSEAFRQDGQDSQDEEPYPGNLVQTPRSGAPA
jgi:sugar phosphate isomerase/epimerase